MRKNIDIEIQIDESCSVPKVIIRANRMTSDIESIVQAIENCSESGFPMVTAYDGEKKILLSQREIVRVFVENRKLIILTDRGEFVTRRTLAEMETLLNRSRFLRISRSEIINLYKVSLFDLSISGTIQVHFHDGTTTWVARRYMKSIRETLGLA